ncbi:MAG: ABC transporter permease subunit [Caldilineaceae bacterium]
METGTVTDFGAFWRSFRRRHLAMLGAIMLLMTIVVALFAPQIAPYDPKAPVRVTIDDIYAPPSAAHWLGTDDAGRDVFSNFVYGARVSLIVGFFASFISVAIGGTLGITAGFYGGRTENVIMRFTDIMLVIPDLPLIVVIVALTKPSLSNIILVIGLLGWTGTARLVRAQTLSVKERKFVLRAQAVGAGRPYIIRRHVLPLVLPLIVVNTVLVISLAILNESTLSFLGLGDPTTLSWGQMLNYAFTRGAMKRRMVGAGRARLRHRVGRAGVHAAGPRAGASAQTAHRSASPLLPAQHGHAHRGRGRTHPAAHDDAARGLTEARSCSHAFGTTDAHTPRPDGAHGERHDDPIHARPLLAVNDLSIDYVNQDGAPAQAVRNVSFTLRGRSARAGGRKRLRQVHVDAETMRLLPSAGRIVGGEVLFQGKRLLALNEAEMADVR